MRPLLAAPTLAAALAVLAAAGCRGAPAGGGEGSAGAAAREDGPPAETAPADPPASPPPGDDAVPDDEVAVRLRPAPGRRLWRVTVRQAVAPALARFELAEEVSREPDGTVRHVHRVVGRVALEAPRRPGRAPRSTPPPDLVLVHRTDAAGRPVEGVRVARVAAGAPPWLADVVARLLRLDPPVGAAGPLTPGATLRYRRRDAFPVGGATRSPVELALRATVDRLERRDDRRVAVLVVEGVVTPRGDDAAPPLGTVRGEVAVALGTGLPEARSWRIAVAGDGGAPIDQVLVASPIDPAWRARLGQGGRAPTGGPAVREEVSRRRRAGSRSPGPGSPAPRTASRPGGSSSAPDPGRSTRSSRPPPGSGTGSPSSTGGASGG